MKKGLAIGLGVAGGILAVGAICGLVFGMNAHVRDYVKNQVDQVVNDDAYDLKDTKIANVIELTKAEKANQGVQADAESPGLCAFQFEIQDLPSEINENSVHLQTKIIKGDTTDAWFAIAAGDEEVYQYESVTTASGEELCLIHELFTKDASVDYTIRTYWIDHPSVYLDTKVTFSYEKEEASSSASASASSAESSEASSSAAIQGLQNYSPVYAA